MLKGWVAGQGWKRSKSKDASGWEHDGQIVRELKAPEALAGMSGRGSQLSSGRVAWFRFSGRRRNHIRLLDAARGHYAHAIALANAPWAQSASPTFSRRHYAHVVGPPLLRRTSSPTSNSSPLPSVFPILTHRLGDARGRPHPWPTVYAQADKAAHERIVLSPLVLHPPVQHTRMIEAGPCFALSGMAVHRMRPAIPHMTSCSPSIKQNDSRHSQTTNTNSSPSA